MGIHLRKNKVLVKCLVLCNTLKDLLSMRLDPPETSKDDAMIQIDGCVMERQK